MKNFIFCKLSGLLIAVNILFPLCTAKSSENPSKRDCLFNIGWKDYKQVNRD
jgi:hypothetical protein